MPIADLKLYNPTLRELEKTRRNRRPSSMIDQVLMNPIEADEAVAFANSVHPTHAMRPVGCWGPNDVSAIVEQSSGGDRLNIHGVIDPETHQNVIEDVLKGRCSEHDHIADCDRREVPGMRFVHVFLDNAGHHHLKSVQVCAAGFGCLIKLHLVPTYCPHFNSIERRRGLMHPYITGIGDGLNVAGPMVGEATCHTVIPKFPTPTICRPGRPQTSPALQRADQSVVLEAHLDPKIRPPDFLDNRRFGMASLIAAVHQHGEVTSREFGRPIVRYAGLATLYRCQFVVLKTDLGSHWFDIFSLFSLRVWKLGHAWVNAMIGLAPTYASRR